MNRGNVCDIESIKLHQIHVTGFGSKFDSLGLEDVIICVKTRNQLVYYCNQRYLWTMKWLSLFVELIMCSNTRYTFTFL